MLALLSQPCQISGVPSPGFTERLRPGGTERIVPLHARAVGSWLGNAVGVFVGVLPWRATLTLLSIVLRWSVGFFEQVEDGACGKEGASIHRLAAHERAQWEFVRRELAGDAQSIDPILAQLEVRR